MPTLVFTAPEISSLLADEPVNLNLDAWFLLQQLKFRIAGSNFFIGGRYLLLKTDNTFEIPIDIPEFDGYEFSSTLSEASLKLELDSRNNIFTPTRGVFLGLSGTYSDTWMGGDDLYGRIGLVLIGYIPAGNKFTVGTQTRKQLFPGRCSLLCPAHYLPARCPPDEIPECEYHPYGGRSKL